VIGEKEKRSIDISWEKREQYGKLFLGRVLSAAGSLRGKTLSGRKKGTGEDDYVARQKFQQDL